MTFLAALRAAFPPPHPAGYPFIAGGLLVCASGLLISPWLAGCGLAFALACLGFFRDPERVAPTRPGVVVAPADGRVVAVGMAAPPAELGLPAEPLPRISIFLSVLDVHVNRVPASGTVLRVAYRAGGFASAASDAASERNERNAIAIGLPDGRLLAVVQIAGLIARRIVCRIAAGEQVARGQRFGLIRFGSRTDLYLPAEAAILVAPGQRMIGGETAVAQLPATAAGLPA